MHNNLQPIKSHANAAYFFSTTSPIRGLDKAINGVPIHIDRREGRRKVLCRNDDGSYSAKLVYGGDQKGAPPAVTWHKDGRFTMHGQNACQSTLGFMESFVYQHQYINYISYTNSEKHPDALVITLLPKAAPHQWVRNYINRKPYNAVKYVATLSFDDDYSSAIDGGMTKEQHNCPVLYTRGDVTFDLTADDVCTVRVDDVVLQYVDLVDKTKAYTLRAQYKNFADYIDFFTAVPLSYDAVEGKANFLRRKETITAESIFEALILDPEDIDAWSAAVHLYHDVNPYFSGPTRCEFKPKHLKREFYQYLYDQGDGMYSRTFRPIGPSYSTAHLSTTTCGKHYDTFFELPSATT